MNDLVSVILPTYNRAHTLLRAVNSVLNQTYKNLELIIVDDCSKDNTEEIVKNIHDERIVYIRHPINKGVAAARNMGIRAAKGKFVAFQDSDDEWFLEKTEKSLAIFNDGKYDMDFLFCSGKIFLNDEEVVIGRNSWINTSSKSTIVSKLFCGNFIFLQSVLLLKERLSNIELFDESFYSASDYEFLLRLLQDCNPYFLDEPLFRLNFSQECITSDFKKRVKFVLLAFKKNQKILKKHLSNQPMFYIIKLRFLSQLVNLIAWDLEHRNEKKLQAFFLFFCSFFIFPNSGISRFLKNLFLNKKS